MKYFVIFALMSTLGWFIEVIYRSWKTKKIVNPGLMLGCTLPVYGIGGLFLEKCFKIKLWDYSTNKYNLKGIICLRMAIIWGIASLFILHL